MQLTTICLSLIVVASTKNVEDIIKQSEEDWDAIFMSYKKQCIEESGVDENDVLEPFEKVMFPDKRNFKCYIKCQYALLNYMDVEGNFNLEKMVNTITALSPEVAKNCIDRASTDVNLCDKAYSFVICAVPKVLTNLHEE
ncbi:hypothetical protein FQA39_LY18343 [Lamprigera yunnana]|nr:hypothetical protein FQA39_LY18343 [Lamprigera yunnana]